MEESKYIELGIAFISGILLTLVGAYLSKYLQTKADNHQVKKEARHKIYMELLNVQSLYFWFTTAELHKESVPSEIKVNARKSSFIIADLLRENDGIEYQGEILEVLFNEGYKTAKERSNKLEEITTKLATKVSPNYNKTISKISKENPEHLYERGYENSNSPGSFR